MSVYPAPQEINDLVAELIQETEFHPELRDVGATVLCQMHSTKTGLKLHGYPAIAVVRLIPSKDRAAGLPDARITIDADTWHDMPAAERRAVLDHELHHLDVVGAWAKGNGENPKRFVCKTDDNGRPKIKIRPHDWELGGFRVIAARHGEKAAEVRSWQATAGTFGQYLMPWDESAVESSSLATAV
jgi:hypothetical protein